MKKLLLICAISTALTNMAKAGYPSFTHLKPVNKIIQNLSAPEFPGGEKAFNKYLSENMNWPDPKSGVQGTVVISFYVAKDGTLSGFKIEKSVEKKFDSEVMKVMQKSPKWIPAKKNGFPIKSKY